MVTLRSTNKPNCTEEDYGLLLLAEPEEATVEYEILCHY